MEPSPLSCLIALLYYLIVTGYLYKANKKAKDEAKKAAIRSQGQKSRKHPQYFVDKLQAAVSEFFMAICVWKQHLSA